MGVVALDRERRAAGGAAATALAAPPALTPCPDKPNCVSTEASGKAQMAPIPFSGTVAEAQDALRRAIAARPRSTITRVCPSAPRVSPNQGRMSGLIRRTGSGGGLGLNSTGAN